MIELRAGPWTASIVPEVGGALRSLHRDGVPILREATGTPGHALETACFPMVPYCNRIGGGRFSWNAREVELGPNVAHHDHPLHGLGWLRGWTTVRQNAQSALIEDDYDGTGEWPWAYRAHQFVALDDAGCTVRLMVENRSGEAAPMGLGLHPYFRRSADSRLQFEARDMLGIDADFLPDGRILDPGTLADFGSGAALPRALVDNCFAGWGGVATIRDPLGSIVIRGFGAPHCHVFAPPGGEELCLEPVNHLPDGINRGPENMPVVQPGCAAGIALRIEAEAP